MRSMSFALERASWQSPERSSDGGVMRALRRLYHVCVIVILAGAAIAFAARTGIWTLPTTILPPLDLKQETAWFMDWRIAALGSSRTLCRHVLDQGPLNAEPIADVPVREGCGIVNGVRLVRAGGVKVSLDRISCPLAAALSLWIEHQVQREAKMRLHAGVAAIQHFGGHACRNIKGPAWLPAVRSEHATGNAIDIAAFVLTDGRSVRVKQHWSGKGPEGEFLRAVHASACAYFRVVLGPDYNELHRDHFHFDRGSFSRCR